MKEPSRSTDIIPLSTAKFSKIVQFIHLKLDSVPEEVAIPP